MSHYWSYKCLDCNIETEGINHGDKFLLALADGFPLILRLKEIGIVVDRVECECSYNSWQFISFLFEHYTHFVIVETEYVSLKNEYPDRCIHLYGPKNRCDK